MELEKILLEKKSSIIDTWCDLARQTYPEESQGFFRKKDQFGNPVGYTITNGIPLLFEALVEGKNKDKVGEVLDSILRIRAIQELSPSDAVGFILGLKSVIRELFEDRLVEGGLSEAWVTLEGQIDSLALLGFDIYVTCRQQIYEIRIGEVQRKSKRLLQMAGLVYEIPEFEGNQQQETHGLDI